MRQQAVEKPSIHIYYDKELVDISRFHEVLWGIEEEEVPYRIQEKEHVDAQQMAYEACEASKLGVGVGIDHENIVLHYVKLKKKEPLYKISTESSRELMRVLGVNGARLVKGIPFKDLQDNELDNELESDLNDYNDLYQNQFEEIVKEVVERVIARMKLR